MKSVKFYLISIVLLFSSLNLFADKLITTTIGKVAQEGEFSNVGYLVDFPEADVETILRLENIGNGKKVSVKVANVHESDEFDIYMSASAGMELGLYPGQEADLNVYLIELADDKKEQKATPTNEDNLQAEEAAVTDVEEITETEEIESEVEEAVEEEEQIEEVAEAESDLNEAVEESEEISKTEVEEEIETEAEADLKNESQEELTEIQIEEIIEVEESDAEVEKIEKDVQDATENKEEVKITEEIVTTESEVKNGIAVEEEIIETETEEVIKTQNNVENSDTVDYLLEEEEDLPEISEIEPPMEETIEEIKYGSEEFKNTARELATETNDRKQDDTANAAQAGDGTKQEESASVDTEEHLQIVKEEIFVEAQELESQNEVETTEEKQEILTETEVESEIEEEVEIVIEESSPSFEVETEIEKEEEIAFEEAPSPSVESEDFESQLSSSEVVMQVESGLYCQVGVFKNLATAKETKNRLMSELHDITTIQKMPKGYHVLIGPIKKSEKGLIQRAAKAADLETYFVVK